MTTEQLKKYDELKEELEKGTTKAREQFINEYLELLIKISQYNFKK